MLRTLLFLSVVWVAAAQWWPVGAPISGSPYQGPNLYCSPQGLSGLVFDLSYFATVPGFSVVTSTSQNITVNFCTGLPASCGNYYCTGPYRAAACQYLPNNNRQYCLGQEGSITLLRRELGIALKTSPSGDQCPTCNQLASSLFTILCNPGVTGVPDIKVQVPTAQPNQFPGQFNFTLSHIAGCPTNAILGWNSKRSSPLVDYDDTTAYQAARVRGPNWGLAVSNSLLTDGTTARVEFLSDNRTAAYGDLVVGVMPASSNFPVEGFSAIPGVKAGIGYSVVGTFVPNYVGLPVAHLGDILTISRAGNRINFHLNVDTFVGALGLPDNGDYFLVAALSNGAAVKILTPTFFTNVKFVY